MASPAQTPADVAQVRSSRTDLKVSVYDRVSGCLIAMLFLNGVAVAVLLAAWLTTFVYIRPIAPPVEYVELAGGDPHQGVGSEYEEPGVEELPDVDTPQIAESLEAISNVMSDKAATLDSISGTSNLMGTGTGLGDSRLRGQGGTGGGSSDVIPPWERWQVRFATNDINTYARQLDFFGIELGAIGGGTPEVFYASGVSQARPNARTAPDGKNEARLRFNYSDAAMKALDRQLLAKAGFDVSRKEPLQFYSADAAARLGAAEAAYASMNGKRMQEVRRTVFGVRPGGGGYEFFVIEQLYRFAPPTPG